MPADAPSLQERFAPRNACFGCGPANPQGLRLASHAEDGRWVARWTPGPHHEAFPGMLNGGIIGALLDCHSNWAAAHHLMLARGADRPPCTVTADFHVKLLRPTPSGAPVALVATVASTDGDRVVVEATLGSGERVTATCRGTFVAVREGHPAFHRW